MRGFRHDALQLIRAKVPQPGTWACSDAGAHADLTPPAHSSTYEAALDAELSQLRQQAQRLHAEQRSMRQEEERLATYTAECPAPMQWMSAVASGGQSVECNLQDVMRQSRKLRKTVQVIQQSLGDSCVPKLREPIRRVLGHHQ
jgi:hypothetical protein